jgi:hypothetical protein
MIKTFLILLLAIISLDSFTQSSFDRILRDYSVDKYTFKIDTLVLKDTNHLIRLLQIIPNDLNSKKVIWSEKINRQINDFTTGQTISFLIEPDFLGNIDSKNNIYLPKEQFLKKTILFAKRGTEGDEVILIRSAANRRIKGLLFAISKDSSAVYTKRADKLFNRYNVKSQEFRFKNTLLNNS